MKKNTFFLFLFITFQLQSQTNTDYLKEINRDIWLPFIEAYHTLNAEKYKNLQSEDFIRAEGDSKRLPNYGDYFKNIEKWFTDLKKNGRKVGIDFRFTERFANGKVASERGIYQLISFDSNGKEVRKSYGKFHVFMRKIAGVWKITVDYDSSEKNTISEQSYLAASAMDDFERY